MGIINRVYKEAAQLFGDENVTISSNKTPPIDVLIDLEHVHIKSGQYTPKQISLSHDGKYYWMKIDDFSWEFDDNVAEFLSTCIDYMNAVKSGALCLHGLKIGSAIFFKRLEIDSKK
ncbi:hypothetical protein JNM87_06720 [Candidatus Saccharibacteria bacterium]|nr:hypothetical protein [Candidatus Saccharibacteria bacterium]